MAQGQDLAAHDPRHGQPGDRAQPAKQGGELQPLRRAVGKALRPVLPFSQHGVQGGDEDDDKYDGRHGIEHIHAAHHHRVPASAAVAGDRAPQHADDQADRRSDQADEQGKPRAAANPAQQIAPVNVGAKPVRAARRLELGVGNGIGRMGHGRGQMRREWRAG